MTVLRRKPAPARRCSGLTLVEMLVVLAIMVTLAGAAIVSTQSVIDQSKVEATQSTLQNVLSAMTGPSGQRQSDGTLLVTGFVADVGRVPQALALSAVPPVVTDSLQELWVQPSSPITQPPATAGLVPMPLSSIQQPVFPGYGPAGPGYPSGSPLMDSDVYLTAGWKGPYLTLPMGNTTLLDGWGNPLSYFNANETPSNPATSDPIQIVASPGANKIFSISDTGFDTDLAVAVACAPPPPPPPLNLPAVTPRYLSSLVANVGLTFTFSSSDTSATFPQTFSFLLLVRVYGPVNGILTSLTSDSVNTFSESVTVSGVPQTVSASFALPVYAPPGPPVVANLSTGPRVVRAYLFWMQSTLPPALATSDASPLASAKSVISVQTLLPGAQTVSLSVPPFFYQIP